MNDLLTIYRKDGNKEDYKLLCIIKKEYQYIIYTSLNNNSIKENICVAKTKNASYLEELIPMDDNDWKLVEKEYQNLLN